MAAAEKPGQSRHKNQILQIMDFIKKALKVQQADKLEAGIALPGRRSCASISASLENYISKWETTKFHEMAHCSEASNCGCSAASGMLDFIILVDASGSMMNEAVALQELLKRLPDMVKEKCPQDLRLVIFGVETHPVQVATFGPNHLSYLQTLHPTAVFAANQTPVGYRTEQGANAIQDLSNYYDWRPGACRAIMYFSDEELEGSSPRNDFATELAATNAAIAAAMAAHVKVSAYYFTNQHLAPDILQNYTALCNNTGGHLYQAETTNFDVMSRALLDEICLGCKRSCLAAAVPDLKPCVSIGWGDSSGDQIESTDFEVLSITLCNCYSNVTFSNVTIGYIYVTNENGTTVANSPGGSPSVEALPVGPICFGDIGPCVNGKPSCKTRQFVLHLQNAKPGKYKLHVGAICYDVNFHYMRNDCFNFEVVLD
jgi:hypothetical protein